MHIYKYIHVFNIMNTKVLDYPSWMWQMGTSFISWMNGENSTNAPDFIFTNLVQLREIIIDIGIVFAWSGFCRHPVIWPVSSFPREAENLRDRKSCKSNQNSHWIHPKDKRKQYTLKWKTSFANHVDQKTQHIQRKSQVGPALVLSISMSQQ